MLIVNRLNKVSSIKTSRYTALLWVALLFSSHGLLGQSSTQADEELNLFVSNIQIFDVGEDTMDIYLNLKNRSKVTFQLKNEIADRLVLEYDKTFKKYLAVGDSLLLIEALLASGYTVQPGRIKMNSKLKVLVPAIVEKIPEETVDSSFTVAIDSVALTDSDSIVMQDTLALEAQVDSNANQVQTDISDSLMTVDSSAGQVDILDSLLAVDSSIVDAAIDSVQTMVEDEDACPDLLVTRLKVIKRTKNYIILAYELKNFGNGTAHIGTANGKEGLALRAFLNSTDALTRGAITVGGKFLEPKLEAIPPNGAYVGEVKWQLYKLTKFTPYLIIQVDPYQMVLECDETNNLNHINLLPEEEQASKE